MRFERTCGMVNAVRHPYPSSSRGSHLATGFTMIEVLVTIAIVGILSGFLAVTWNKFSAKMRVSTALNEMRDAFLTARSDAITRKRYSGIVVDFPNRTYVRFLDSSSDATTSQNCRYEIDEAILQSWTALPANVQVYNTASSISPTYAIRNCDAAATSVAATVQTGAYSVVFRPDGSSCASLSAKIGIVGFPSDTFRLTVQPPAGLVTLEK